MTEKHIIGVFFRQYKDRAKYLVSNLHMWRGESDIVTLNDHGFFFEFEIKISRADLLNDRKKSFHTDYLGGRQFATKTKYEQLLAGEGPNRFYYLLPESLYEKCLDVIPDFAGVFTVSERGWIEKHKEAKLLHKIKATEQDTIKLLRAAYYKTFNRILQDKQI